MRALVRLGAMGVLFGALLPMVLGAPAQAKPKKKTHTVVSLGFDDADASHWRAAQILRKHHMRGTFYINSGDLGQPGKLTAKQVRELAKLGQEIGGHTLNHVRLPDLTALDQRADICADRQALVKLKIRVTTFAYPFGALNADSRNAARFCGYNAARGVGGLAFDPCDWCAVVEPMRPPQLYAIRTYGSINDDTRLADLKRQVTMAERTGGLLPVVIHKVCARPCGTYSTTERLLDEFLTWLEKRKKSGTVVRPLGEHIGGPNRPVPDESEWQRL